MLRHLDIPVLTRQGLRTIAGVVCTLALAVGIAAAGVSVPVIDGNGDDLINYGAAIGNDGCAVDIADARDDISIADLSIVPCATLEDTDGNAVADYYVNGKDLRRFVAVHNSVTNTLYLLWRAEGFIGDVDGNGNPDNNLCVPPASFPDQLGIGSEDSYEARIDTNCDGESDILITVVGNAVSVSGAAVGSTQFAYVQNAGVGATGKDLELVVNNIVLPPVFKIFAFSGAIRDGLGEDVTAERQCGEPAPSIDIVKTAEPASICPGGTTVFTLAIQNTGNVTLDPVNVKDTLPAGLSYVEIVSNTCGGAVSAVGQEVSVGPFSLAPGASCTIQIRALAAESCLGQVNNVAEAVGQFQSPCYNNGEVAEVSDTDNEIVTCNAAPCVNVDAACTPAKACPGTPVTVTGTATNCGLGAETIYLTVAGEQRQFDNVAPGGQVSFDKIVSMPACTDGQAVQFDVSAYAVTGCGETQPVTDNCSVECDTPQIEVDKSVSPEGAVDQGTLLSYTITVTNPSKDVAAGNIVVTDVLCDEVLYAGNASPPPTSEPAVGGTGSVVWNLETLAPGASATFTFDARVRELSAPECEATDRECTNNVTVVAHCGDAEARDTDSVTTQILPCITTGLCRLTGGGCLNEDGGNRGHKQSTFGGNSSPAHEGGGPTGNSWEHVYRDGRTILFNWHSWDAHVIQCSVVSPGPCHPAAENTRADFVGTGKYSTIDTNGRELDGNMVAYIIDHKEGACNKDSRDEYSIIVREGLVIGEGAIVFQTSGEIDCGNLQIHETPAWLFSGSTGTPKSVGSIESVALLNRAVPNPFTGSMSYAYEVVGQDQPVDIGVYNVAGRLVKSLVKSTQPAGRHTASWNGTDEGGVRVSGGVYFVRVRLGADVQQHRVIFLGQ